MTNTLYFHTVFRSDNESVSSSELQISEMGKESVVNVEAPSLYSVIGKACLGCARPETDTQSTISDFPEQIDQLTTGLDSEEISSSDSEDDYFVSPNLKCFSFEELKTATKNFRLDAGDAFDGNWSASKAWIVENRLSATKLYTGSPVAVVFLNQDRSRGNTQRLKELESLGRLFHPNLVSLYGYCLHNDLSLLVYEFLPRKSLFASWSIRMKIALGAAKGLSFLHSMKVIHQDFNSSAILLDKNYNTKLCNFWFPKDRRESNEIYGSTAATGTPQYMAPEYIATGRIAAKSNVYCFGVVLLEILSRRRAFDPNRPFGEINLVEWATPYLTKKQKIFIALDKDLHGQCSLRSAQKVARLVLQCLNVEAKERPSMEMVVKSLEQLQD